MPAYEPSTTHNDSLRLAADNLACQRGERLLFKNVNLAVSGGNCLHVTGANGSGKTSLLRMLCGISRVDQGQIRWQQDDISGNQNYFSSLAYLGHKDGLKNEITAAENLEFYQHMNFIHDEQEVDAALAQMEILECADLRTFQLSFGQRRRLALARLLLAYKPLWVLDEPFTGIDRKGRELIEQLCVNHLTAGGMIVLTNHQSLRKGRLQPFLHELAL